MTNYFEVKAMSASAIKAGAESMLKMHCMIEEGLDESPAMRKGTLFHKALLEPEKFQKVVLFDCRRGTKAHDALIAEHGEENLTKTAEYEQAKRSAEMVKNHPEVIENNLFGSGESEKEIYWTEDGIKCKAKLDFLSDADYWIEYKTTAKLDTFLNKAAQMRYELQLGWYHRAARMLDGKKRKCFIVSQEQSRPYDVAVWEVPQIMLDTWFTQALAIVHRYINGDRSGAFPKLMTFELPAWAPGANAEHDAETILEF